MVAPHDRVNVGSCREFGELTMLFKRGERTPSIWSRELAEEALTRLESFDYDPRVDYLLVAGNMVTMIKVAAALAASCDCEVKALCYDAASGQYVEQDLGLAQEKAKIA